MKDREAERLHIIEPKYVEYSLKNFQIMLSAIAHRDELGLATSASSTARLDWMSRSVSSLVLLALLSFQQLGISLSLAKFIFSTV